MVKMNEIPICKDGIEVRELGDEIIIISVDGKYMHTLTDTGRFIWELIDGERTVDSILDIICKEYNVNKDQAKLDLLSFMNMLITKKLIVSAEKD